MARTKQTALHSTAARSNGFHLQRQIDLLTSPPKTLEEFVNRLLGKDDGQNIMVSLYGPIYQAKFQLASGPNDIRLPSTKPLSEDTLKSIFTREEVLSYLAPQDILALWQTSKACWLNSLKRRQTVMLQSVFLYLRISEEAAQCVQETYVGGWKAFLPRLVGMCHYLATKVYGFLEPDLAHRVYIAEQACFQGCPRNPCKMGKLASHEVTYRDDDDDDENIGPHMGIMAPWEQEDELEGPIPVPSLEGLWRVNSEQIGWGHPEFAISHEPTLPAWFEEHRQWMQNQAIAIEAGQHEEYNQYKQKQVATTEAASTATAVQEREEECKEAAQKKQRCVVTKIFLGDMEGLAQNGYVLKRLAQGLHPSIWLSYDTGAETSEDLMLVGPELEQIHYGYSTYYELSTYQNERQNKTQSFTTCLFPILAAAGKKEPGHDHYTAMDFPGGIVGYLIGSPCAIESTMDRHLTMGILIWCMRHGIPPFDNPLIRWNEVIDAIAATEAAALDPRWRRLQRHEFGNVNFYKQALTSPLFGPADLNKYTSML